MADIKIHDIKHDGSDFFANEEGFMQDLAEDELDIIGGKLIVGNTTMLATCTLYTTGTTPATVTPNNTKIPDNTVSIVL